MLQTPSELHDFGLLLLRRSVVVERYVRKVAALLGTNVDCDHALIVRVELHLQVVEVRVLGVNFFLAVRAQLTILIVSLRMFD